eukprot:scaffold26685_cov90-Isochrysis_galbana.AAC.1
MVSKKNKIPPLCPPSNQSRSTPPYDRRIDRSTGGQVPALHTCPVRSTGADRRARMMLLLSAAVLGQCPPNQFPRGVAFDFLNAVETVNNLGGIPGGPGLVCQQQAGTGGPITSCGAGCACTPESAAAVAGPGTPQELRFTNAGAVSCAARRALVLRTPA